MPGRSGPVISFNSVDSSVSSLKTCLTYISTGMELATNVALDLVESESDNAEVQNMENVMLEYAAMDRELHHFIQAVENTTHQIRRETPEKIPDLKMLVNERFTELQSGNNDADLRRNEKYVQFKEQLRALGKQSCSCAYLTCAVLYQIQRLTERLKFKTRSINTMAVRLTIQQRVGQVTLKAGLSEDAENEQNIEQLDEDIAVTQTELNFICPVTQLEMKKPMKNKVCGHTYEEEAIIRMIQNRHQKNKKARCPKVGCDHSDVQVTDLVLDTTLKRAIESQNKQKGRQNSL